MKALIIFISLIGLVIVSAASLKTSAPKVNGPQYNVSFIDSVDNMPESCFDEQGEFDEKLNKECKQ
jgi:hypothetical protein